MSDSVRPHRWQPTRLPRPWDSPGKNTGVGCHCLLQCMKVNSESEVAQSCPTLATLWTAAYQAPPSMGFSRQKYWSGCHCLLPENSNKLLRFQSFLSNFDLTSQPSSAEPFFFPFPPHFPLSLNFGILKHFSLALFSLLFTLILLVISSEYIFSHIDFIISSMFILGGRSIFNFLSYFTVIHIPYSHFLKTLQCVFPKIKVFSYITII